MLVGILGSPADPQVRAVAAALKDRGADVVVVDSQALNDGLAHGFDGERFVIGGVDVSRARAWYLRHAMTPVPPAFASDDGYRLYGDWFVEYMRRRERFAFQLSLLLSSTFAGVPVVNPPEHGGVVQLKPFQLFAARALGLVIPSTEITNDPARVRALRARAFDVVYKPALGGGLCEPLDDDAMARLDDIAASPVIFQERVAGTNVRVTLVGDELVSAVDIPAATLDFRADPTYRAGDTEYVPCAVDDDVKAKLVALMRACGLVFSCIDLVRRPDGELVFLEANSSPIWLDIELKTGAPITARLADLLLAAAARPHEHAARVDEARRTRRSFVRYALPFDPDTLVS